MPKLKLSNSAAERLVVEERTDFYDAGSPVVLRVDPKGRKTWCVRYTLRSKRSRFELGSFPTLKYAEARAEAERILGAVRDGRDPQVERVQRRQAKTVAEVAEQYLLQQAPRKLKSTTLERYQTMIRRDILPVFGSWAVGDVDRPSAKRFLREIEKRCPASVNLHQAVLSNILNFAVDEGILKFNQLRGMSQLFSPQSKGRSLTARELQAIWNQLARKENATCLALRVHLLTGQRSREVLNLRRGDIEPSGWWWDLKETKAGRPHRIFLAEPVRQLIEQAVSQHHGGPRDFVFRGRLVDQPLCSSGYTEMFQQLCGPVLEGYARPHDFRHTFVTWLHGRKMEGHIRSVLVNHQVQETTSKITAQYNHHHYAEERQEWFTAYADYVMECVYGPKPLPRVKFKFQGRSLEIVDPGLYELKPPKGRFSAPQQGR